MMLRADIFAIFPATAMACYWNNIFLSWLWVISVCTLLLLPTFPQKTLLPYFFPLSLYLANQKRRPVQKKKVFCPFFAISRPGENLKTRQKICTNHVCRKLCHRNNMPIKHSFKESFAI